MNPIVSVIMATYNASGTIGMAIDSLLSQSYKNWELLIINDGSTDNTHKVLHSIEDSRIQYFFQKNQGVAIARNVGLQAMKGDYFCFLDADDIMPKKSLESRLSVFGTNENIEFVDGKVIIYNSDFSKILNNWLPKFYGNPLIDLLKLTGNSFFGPSWMIKRKKELNYQFKEGLTHGEDLLFYINLAKERGIYSYTEEPILYYRKGHQSAMSNLKGLEEGYRSIYKEIVEMQNITEELKQTYLNKAKSIMFKSYLGDIQPLSALNAYFSNW